MSPSAVFFTDMRASQKENLLEKIERLLGRLELENVVPPRGLTAIKLHFGEKGGTAFLRPVLVRRIVDVVRSLGGRPFLTDTNTLYSGS